MEQIEGLKTWFLCNEHEFMSKEVIIMAIINILAMMEISYKV